MFRLDLKQVYIKDGTCNFFYERTACLAEGNTFIVHLHYIQIRFKTSLYQSQANRGLPSEMPMGISLFYIVYESFQSLCSLETSLELANQANRGLPSETPMCLFYIVSELFQTLRSSAKTKFK